MEVDGKTVIKKEVQPETYVTTKRVAASETVKLAAEELKLADVHGNAVSLAAVRSRLVRPTLILLTADGKLHASYVGLFKPETLILTQPATPAPRVELESAPPPPSSDSQALSVLPVTPADSPPVQLVRYPDKTAGHEQRTQPKSPFPTRSAPTVRYCRVQDQGKTIAVRHFNERKFTKTAYRDVETKGVTRKEPFHIQKTIGEDETTYWDRATVKFLTPAGKPIQPAQVSAMFTAEAAVIASSDGEPVDPFWLQNVNPDACVIVLPRFHFSQPSAPQPIPVPAPSGGSDT